MSTEQAPVTPIHWEIHETHPDLVPALRAALAQVVDPEIGMNVLQLGLIRKVRIEEGTVHINMLLTTPFCPYGPAMIEITRQKANEGLKMPVEVEFGMEPWDFSMMEDPGALDWGMYT
jgi:metal-sulfur cluster biosynthetic enzyme